MGFKNYDIVRITKPFELEVNGKKKPIDSNIEGVIVESFDNEYLIEFTDNNDETHYVVIKSDDIEKIWDAPD